MKASPDSPSSSPSFAWHDVEKYNQRLRSFHPEKSKSNSPTYTPLLPLEISPIQCARFGWSRRIIQQSNTDDGGSKGILLQCQDCDAIMCIQFHPLLSRQSKLKLTLKYREMLSTCHKQGCNFQYDALPWLAQHDSDNRDSSKLDDDDDNNDTKQSQSSGGGQPEKIECMVVPPYLIHLSNEYQMLQNNYSTRIEKKNSGTRTTSNAIILTGSCSQAFQHIHNECLRFGKYIKKLNKDATNRDGNQNSTSWNFLDDEVICQMMSIVSSSSSIGDGEKKEITNSTLHHHQQQQQQEINLANVLDQIIQIMKTKTIIFQENQKRNNIDDGNTENEQNPTSIHEKLKKIQNIINEENNHDDQNHKVMLWDDTKSPIWMKYVTREILLLALFGWRILHTDDEDDGEDIVESNSLSNNCQQVDSVSSPPNKNSHLKCPICQNCVPFSFQQLGGNQNYCGHGTASDSPHQKKRRIDFSTNSVTEDEMDVNNRGKNMGDGNNEHKFHVIRSHRYYCPYVNGFHQGVMLETNDEHESSIYSQTFGSLIPSWNIVWRSLLKSSEFSFDNILEDTVNSIRSGIRASIS